MKKNQAFIILESSIKINKKIRKNKTQKKRKKKIMDTNG